MEPYCHHKNGGNIYKQKTQGISFSLRLKVYSNLPDVI